MCPDVIPAHYSYNSSHLDKDEVDVIINEDLESLPDLLVNLLLAPAIPAAHSRYLFVC